MPITAALLMLAGTALAAPPDPCATTSSASDVRFTLAVKDGRAVFQEGEIIPLVLSFASTAKNRYRVDARTYDRSGRLDIELYCVEPAVPDPLESYLKFVGFSGGMYTTKLLDETPFQTEAELNEWRRLAPGRYRLSVISYGRVWREPEPRDKERDRPVYVVLRSNIVEIEVQPADPQWRSQQLRSAAEALAKPVSQEEALSEPPSEARRAARRIRFLNTEDSTRQVARLFVGLNERQPGVGFDLMFGLYGSPYRKLAIEAMRAELIAPGHAITDDYLRTLVGLQIKGDPAWDEVPWERRRPHERELTQAEAQRVIAGLPRKSGKIRAVTLEALLLVAEGDEAILKTIRPALIAAWADLPPESRLELITNQWRAICAPEMLPILRHIVAELPTPPRKYDSTVIELRNAALKRLYEFDPAAARKLIAADLLDPNARPTMDVVELLSKEDVAAAMPAVVKRIRTPYGGKLDYKLLDRYADATFLASVQSAFDPGDTFSPGRDGLLRYFLRVDPAYGVKQLQATLKASAGRYDAIFAGLGDELPRVQQLAIQALNDPDPKLVEDAAVALGKWGTAEVEPALWARLEQFHKEWAGRESELRYSADEKSPGVRAANMGRSLIEAIMHGNAWICGPDKLARLRELAWVDYDLSQIDATIAEWKAGDATILAGCCGEDRQTFSLLQYISLTEDQLRLKLAQLPKGMRLSWQFWPPGQFSRPFPMAKQQAFYERMRTVAEQHGLILEKGNHP